jgi:transposase
LSTFGVIDNPVSGERICPGRSTQELCGDLIKMLWWDGDGLWLFAKKLERGRFIWPQATKQ